MQTQRTCYPTQRTLVHSVEHDDYPVVTFRCHLERESEDLILEGGREKTVYFWEAEVDEVELGTIGFPPEIARTLLDPDWFDLQVEEIKFRHNAETQSF